jgi:hypothetical protein
VEFDQLLSCREGRIVHADNFSHHAHAPLEAAGLRG